MHFILSLLGGATPLCIDAQGASNEPGTPIGIFTPNFVPSNTPATEEQLEAARNQLWTYEPGPTPGSFFIQSSMRSPAGEPLVLDVIGADAEPGKELVLWPKKAIGTPELDTDARNQLWIKEGADGQILTSLLKTEAGDALHLTVQGFDALPGAALVVDVALPEPASQSWTTGGTMLIA